MRMNCPSKRFFAGFLALFMLISILFSLLFITKEINHHCHGEECPICDCLRQCEMTLKNMGSGVIVCTAFVFPIIFILFTENLFVSDFSRKTPVRNKVRLNN